ncbi:unnamed protein product [Coregonus sp. 'balchen']|nr:unnamed protein product [Coregonus sp. 'balchen']
MSDIGFDRFTFGFTIKDSPDYLINVSSWGNDEYINGLSNSFSIGDCVIIENPLVAPKDPEKEDRLCPSTPRLLDSRDFNSLGDIVANGQSLDRNVINILTDVRSVAEPKYFTTEDGRKGQRLEVKLFDDSVTSFPLVIDRIRLLSVLQVLFILDARFDFDSFRNCMTATVNSKTIITVNPDTKEASLLFSYAKEISASGVLDEDDRPGDVPVRQLKLKAQENPEVFCGITYSFISKLDLDASVSKVIRSRW